MCNNKSVHKSKRVSACWQRLPSLKSNYLWVSRDCLDKQICICYTQKDSESRKRAVARYQQDCFCVFYYDLLLINEQQESRLIISMRVQCCVSCTADYREWEVQRREKVTADNTYRPTSAQFEGISNYSTDYIPRSGAPRQIMRPNEAAKMSDQPFEDATDYRQSYIKYQLPPREVGEKVVWEPNTAKLDDLSHYRRDYTPKEVGKQQTCKPDSKPFQSVAPFEGDTTQKVDFIEWPTERIKLRERECYQKPDGDMNMDTTTQIDYTRKPLERVAMARPQEGRRVAGKFDGTTNYQVEYLKWEATDRSRPAPKQAYEPNEAPFEGLATYQTDYIPYQMSLTRSLKPVDLGYSSGAPLDDCTEYRDEYYKKKADRCPVPFVEAGTDTRYTFREQDDVGHKLSLIHIWRCRRRG